jgi:hypothetical protein
MTDCNPCSTLVDTQDKLSEAEGPPVSDPTAYRSLAGALQYLTFTRSDITYAVQQICLHMHDPREPHLTALKRLLRYLRGTIDYGLLLHRSSFAELVVYTDVDWAGCPDTRRSTSGYAIFLGGNLVSWSSKHQHVVSRSSAEAEYRVVANGVAEASWLRQLLAELHTSPSRSTLIYCNNVSAVYLSTNTSGRSTWRSTYTLSVIGLPWARCGSFMFGPPPSSRTSSPKASRPRPSPSFAPASTSPVASCVCGGLVCVLSSFLFSL